MGGADSREVLAGFVQAQLAVDSETDLGSVCVLLAVVFPPADGAQLHHARRNERPKSATWAAKAGGHNSPLKRLRRGKQGV